MVQGRNGICDEQGDANMGMQIANRQILQQAGRKPVKTSSANHSGSLPDTRHAPTLQLGDKGRNAEMQGEY